MAIVGHDMQKLFTQGIIPFAHKKCQILLEPGLQYRPRSGNQCAPVLMKTAKTKKKRSAFDTKFRFGGVGTKIKRFF
jgi:hypothetical protein